MPLASPGRPLRAAAALPGVDLTEKAPQPHRSARRLDLLGEEALEALDEARQLRGGASAAAWPRKPLEAARTRTGTALSLGALAWRSCFSTFSTDSDPVIRLPRSRCSQVQHETHLPTPAPAGAAPLLQSWATILEAELHAWHCLAKRIQAVKTSLVSSYLPPPRRLPLHFRPLNGLCTVTEERWTSARPEQGSPVSAESTARYSKRPQRSALHVSVSLGQLSVTLIGSKSDSKQL